MECLDMETLCMHLDHELDARMQRDVAEHLSTCQSCRDKLGALGGHDAMHKKALISRGSRPVQGHTCYSAEELSAYASGQLTPQETVPFERHLQGCDVCLGEVMAIRRMMSLLDREPLLAPPANLVATAKQALASGEPEVAQASPGLGARVLAWIDRKRARLGGFGWVPPLASPAWASALAAVLVLSLSLNLWWGFRGSGTRLPEGRQVAGTMLGDGGAAGRLQIYRFQAGMQRVNELGTIVAAQSPVKEPAAVIGFTPQATRTTFFRMGELYAEALAALQGGAVEVAASRLDILTQALANVQAPRVLAQYLREMHGLLQSRQHGAEVLATFLALFEPLYEDAYARGDMTEGLTLFRAGAWVENMYLAAASGDATALRQGGQAVDEVSSALARLNAPRGVLEALDRMHPLVSRQNLTDRDISVIRTLVQDIQGMLGE
jgi:anti-sigma factor RsiW